MAHREQLGEAEQLCWAFLRGQDTEVRVVPPPSQVLTTQAGW